VKKLFYLLNTTKTTKLSIEDKEIIEDIYGEVTPETIKEFKKANGGN
jgi:uncharacterized protein YnzC (UPF0291/DUF896 family)